MQWDREPVRDKSGEVMLLTRDTKFGKKGTPRTRKVPVMTTEPAYPDRDREDIEKRFRNGDIDILCCTIAFGMGVDIAGIRTVIHDSFRHPWKTMCNNPDESAVTESWQSVFCLIILA